MSDLSDTLRASLSQLVRVRAIFAALALLICLAGNVRAGFLYVINQINGASNQIYGYNVNESTGALTALAGFPVATGGNGTFNTHSEQITIDRRNRRLFVINDGSNTVSAYSINSATGALTALPFSPIALGTGIWATIAAHPSGSPLIVGDSAGKVNSYNITATTATAAAGSPFSTGAASPFSSVFSRDGSYFYTGGNSGNSFAGFSVDQANGVLTALAGSPFTSNFNPKPHAADSSGRIFTSTRTSNNPEPNTGQVGVFTTSSGVPTGVTGSPFVSGLTNAVDGVLSPNEMFYYVADRIGNRVGAYQIAGSGSSTTLTAVAGSPFASSGTFTDALVFNNSGNFLFAANGDSRNITTYSADTGTGVLTFNNVQAANTLGTAGLLTGIDYLPTAAPTAASVSVGGRVLSANGRAISRARVTLTNLNGETRTALTNSLGYYRFEDVGAGETYIFAVISKRYSVAPQVVTVTEDLTDLDFTAHPNAGKNSLR